MPYHAIDDEELRGFFDATPARPGLPAMVRRIGGRYTEAERAEELAARDRVPAELLVRLLPDTVVSAADLD